MPLLVVASSAVAFAGMIPFLGGGSGVARAAAPSGYSNGQLIAQTPYRILDTRGSKEPLSGGGYTGHGPLRANVVYTMDLSRTKVPADAFALALNVTAVEPTSAAGNLRIGPSCGDGAPKTSLVNYQAGKVDIANYVVVPLQCSPSGRTPVSALTLYSAGASTHVTIDVTGYYPTEASGTPTGDGFAAVTPYRAADTRNGTNSPRSPIPANSARAFHIDDVGTGDAVAINVTVVAQPHAGNLRVYPDGDSVPRTSNVNFIPGVDKAGFVIVLPGGSGDIDIYAAGAAANVVIDVFGYYEATNSHGQPSPPLFPQAPQRILDTRSGGAASQGLPDPLAANSPYEVQVSGNGGVPQGATAALLSVTSIEPGGSGVGNLRVYPGGQSSPPEVSNINYLGYGFDIANFVIAPLSNDGKITLYSANSPVNVTVDVLGYYKPQTSGPTSPPSATSTQTT